MLESSPGGGAEGKLRLKREEGVGVRGWGENVFTSARKRGAHHRPKKRGEKVKSGGPRKTTAQKKEDRFR